MIFIEVYSVSYFDLFPEKSEFFKTSRYSPSVHLS